MRDIMVFIEWIIINLILGNSDAHAKNISFFVSKKGLRITPFYDIVNINLIKNNAMYDKRLSMAIGDQFDIEKLNSEDFEKFYIQNNLQPKMVVSKFEIISKKIIKALDNKAKYFHEKLEEDFYNRYKEDVLKRVERLRVAIKEPYTP